MVHYPGRVSIIGAGTLGGTIAYSLIMEDLAKEILLVDMSSNIVQGQVLDLAEASEGTNIVLRAGTFKEAGQSSLVIITADVEPYDDEERNEWLTRSRRLFLGIMSSMSPIHDDILILVASEPADLYVHVLADYFPRLSPKRVFGIGTTMATFRFQTWLTELTDTNINDIKDAYCIGTQSDPIIVWSCAKVQDSPVTFIPLLVSQKPALDTIVSNHRYHLIRKRKGRAWYGVAATVTRLIKEFLNLQKKGKGRASDQVTGTSNQRTWVLSVYVPHLEAYMSWPVKLNSQGIKEIIHLPLSTDELEKINKVKELNQYDFQTSAQLL
ncbi:hypothetical protein INT48_007935 [Thamnidium elegans]|uniref:Lactate/malate dehydrogenase N-terminal domain-containing protein n=1 Tax=Thamnidium elegans TaxID=101142 RepID=A0A8H7SR39_9FUNG|nr:hypothetical protein INT48_007935 [Thamnidium elegans]